MSDLKALNHKEAGQKAADSVSRQWEALGRDAQADFPEMQPVITLAHAHKKLRQLFPFVGVAGLGFSRCCDYPFFVDILICYIEPKHFAVQKTNGDGGWAISTEIGRGNAEEAIEIAALALPETYGPAILGNANTVREINGVRD